VVYDGVEIHYSGGPMILENVVFISCKFVMDNTAPNRNLAEVLLASDRIDFKTPPA
jgi:hypothetical protein